MKPQYIPIREWARPKQPNPWPAVFLILFLTAAALGALAVHVVIDRALKSHVTNILQMVAP